MNSEHKRSPGFLRNLDTSMVFISTFVIVFIATKFQGFLYGNAIDDYFNRFTSPDAAFQFVMTQGRFTWALFIKLAAVSGLNPMDFVGVGMLALALASALLFWTSLRETRLDDDANWRVPAVVVAAMLAAHPYMTEYVSFRITLVPMAAMTALCALSLVLFNRSIRTSSKRDLAFAVVVGALAVGANQLALSFLAIGALLTAFRISYLASASTAPKDVVRLWIAQTLKSAAYVIVVVIAFFALWKILAAIFHIGAGNDPRATFIGLSEIPKRMGEVSTLFAQALLANENFLSATAKLLIIASLGLLMVGQLLSRRFLYSLVILIFLSVALILAVTPISIASVWWPVPRTLIAIPFAIAATFLLLCHGLGERWRMSAITLMAAAIFLLGAHSTRILIDQQRLNHWDATTAMRIIERMEEETPNSSKLAIVNPSYTYGIDPAMPTGDMNVSALSVGYAVDPLFEEVSGTQRDVRVAPELADLCLTRPKFPKSGSLFTNGNETVVCM